MVTAVSVSNVKTWTVRAIVLMTLVRGRDHEETEKLTAALDEILNKDGKRLEGSMAELALGWVGAAIFSNDCIRFSAELIENRLKQRNGKV